MNLYACKKYSLFFLILIFFIPLEAQNVTSYVNPFLGSDRGNVMPGACLPFGLVRLSPDVEEPQPTSGYNFKKNIVGFSHTHTSGTGGGPRYGNIQIIPQVGELTIKDRASLKRVNEFASPGYYTVTLARKPGDVKAELTCTEHVGFHQYRFFTWKGQEELDVNILIDVSHVNTRGKASDSRCTGGSVHIESDTMITGWGAFAGGWGKQNPYQVYFAAVFDRPFESSGIWKDQTFESVKKEIEIPVDFDSRHYFGAYGRFKLKQLQSLQIKVAISLVSIEKAIDNLNEISHWSFEETRLAADSVWNDHLSRIQINGGTPEQRIQFYSCLRNTMIMPTDVIGETPGWDEETPHYWDHYCLWDVFRTVMPLHTLILPDRQRSIINGLLGIYKKKGWLPDAWVAGDYADVQGGTNADVILTDAIVKNLDGFDHELALEAMLKNGSIPSDQPAIYGRYLNDYLKYGYVTKHSTNGASSRSLEYAYNDFCISQSARELDKKNIAKTYQKRANQIFNIFSKEEGYFWARDTTGEWEPDFSRHSKLKASWNDPFFYEGGSETYSFYVPHNMTGLIKKMGGKAAFINKLDELFDSGRFKLGNEPLFLVPYAYHYAGRPDQSAKRIREILNLQFSPGSRGLPGQDDSGAISSWYVFSAMGIFPVAGQDIYLIGSPIFHEVNILLENNRLFKIIAEDVSDVNQYIVSATLNGQQLNQCWFRHDALINGGELILHMSSEPTDWGSINLPPSFN